MLSKKTIILNQAKLLFLVFGILALIISLIAYFTQGIVVIFYPIMFTAILTIFCLATLFCFDIVKNKREEKFFSKNPFLEIEKLTKDKIQVFNSKYDFPKNIRIIELNKQEYEVIYFDDFFKAPIFEVLIIQNLSKKDAEPYILNYKTTKYSQTELLNLIREI